MSHARPVSVAKVATGLLRFGVQHKLFLGHMLGRQSRTVTDTASHTSSAGGASLGPRVLRIRPRLSRSRILRCASATRLPLSPSLVPLSVALSLSRRGACAHAAHVHIAYSARWARSGTTSHAARGDDTSALSLVAAARMPRASRVLHPSACRSLLVDPTR